ncbi:MULTISPECIES: fimbrial protein [Myxococcus]|uniref:fimbrial protein n=1 Tax=Myxococcus TaxID=32 RepID=UPI00114485D1|nr:MULTISPECIES: fimbrial protein [Myxococcus]NOK02687.1 fimbrial protein [Myxococcus xanthus]
MATNLECPKCGSELDVSGRSPGAIIRCACGNLSAVPKRAHWGSLRGVALSLGLLFLCPCVGVLTAIAIPNYKKFPVRSKQAECKANLRALYKAQRHHHAEHGAFEPRILKAGFVPEHGNRYAYFTGPGPLVTRDTVDEAATPPTVPEDAGGIGVDRSRDERRRAVTLTDLPGWVSRQVGVSGTCPDCDVTLACAGDIDIDATVDVWLISTKPLKDEDGETVPPGTPVNVVNDVDN